MRVLLPSAAALIAFQVTVAAASTVGVPVVDSYTWKNGESKRFELAFNGSQATFEIKGVGTSVYGTLDACCGDTFDRVREVHPGASLMFTDLAINTMPVNTVFYDNLSLSLMKRGALDNLGLLTGIVTLRWDDPYARMTYMMFDANPGWMASMGFAPSVPRQFVMGGHSGNPHATPKEGDAIVTPEPGTMVLLGLGLLGLTTARRRQLAGRATVTRR